MNGNADGYYSPDITYSIDLLLYNLKTEKHNWDFPKIWLLMQYRYWPQGEADEIVYCWKQVWVASVKCTY